MKQSGMSVRSRSQAVGGAPTGVGLEARLAQVLAVGQRTFGHQTDGTGVKPGLSGREKSEKLLERNRAAAMKHRQHVRAGRKWDDDYDTWTPILRIKDYGPALVRGRGVAAKCGVTLTWEKRDGRRASLAQAVAEVLREWVACELQDGGYGIAGAGAPSVMSKDPNGPTALNDVEILAQADEGGAAMYTSMVAEIVKLVDPNAPIALAPGYFDNVPKSDFLPCFDEYENNDEYWSGSEDVSED